jgi:hypothetical protein
MHEAEPTCIVEIVHVQDFDLFHSCICQHLLQKHIAALTRKLLVSYGPTIESRHRERGRREAIRWPCHNIAEGCAEKAQLFSRIQTR